jgi:hypothetical protein
MLKIDRRPDFKTVDRWAIELLLEAGAIHKCEHHGSILAAPTDYGGHSRLLRLQIGQAELRLCLFVAL